MRMKMVGEEVDYGEFCRMIDAFLDAGFNYFDTAHGYINGKNITEALRKSTPPCFYSVTPKYDSPLAQSLLEGKGARGF